VAGKLFSAGKSTGLAAALGLAHQRKALEAIKAASR